MRDRPPIDELSEAGRSLLSVFAESGGKPVGLGQLIIASNVPSAQVDELLRGELKWWIDSMILDELELRCEPEVLARLVPPPVPEVQSNVVHHVRRVSKLKPEKIKPYPWQSRAFNAWRDAGYRGIVEAVTGTGKTHLGVMAVEEARKSSEPIYPLIVVPTIPVMEQWVQRLQNAFPDSAIGRIGDGTKDNFANPGTAAIHAFEIVGGGNPEVEHAWEAARVVTEFDVYDLVLAL